MQGIRRLINIKLCDTHNIELTTGKKFGRPPGDELAVHDRDKDKSAIEASSIHLTISSLESVVVRLSQALERVSGVCAAEMRNTNKQVNSCSFSGRLTLFSRALRSTIAGIKR
jgi:hypothetical protein